MASLSPSTAAPFVLGRMLIQQSSPVQAQAQASCESVPHSALSCTCVCVCVCVCVRRLFVSREQSVASVRASGRLRSFFFLLFLPVPVSFLALARAYTSHLTPPPTPCTRRYAVTKTAIQSRPRAGCAGWLVVSVDCCERAECCQAHGQDHVAVVFFCAFP
ncbi:hypothetical protein BD289DRAFT_34501 [Coniella lustricola]|uniref:Uncharacterized protein n=1 Tax=Coniella lustricola TaxID=2025994 RepID=A0A2T3A2I5_9PEZI|nr:hypothetical protein BD289DRAFT_34501 [Coniella lustricola]